MLRHPKNHQKLFLGDNIKNKFQIMRTKDSVFRQKNLPAWIVVVFQVCAYIFVALSLRLLYRAQRFLPKNIGTLSRGSLLIANHQSLLDPFIVTANLPACVFFRLVPIYFPVHHFWISKRVFRNILPCLGCYDVGDTRKEKMLALFYTHQLLTQKKTVFLFPEGEISKEEIKEFKRGIEYFIQVAVNVVFVRMEGFHSASMRTKRKLFYSEVEVLKGRAFDAVSLREYVEGLKKGMN